MKSKEEIEKLAKDYAETFRLKTQKIGWYFEKIEDYTKGYTQCQEDMAKELEALREAIRKNTWYDEDGLPQVNLYGIDSNLLNKQDYEKLL